MAVPPTDLSIDVLEHLTEALELLRVLDESPGEDDRRQQARLALGKGLASVLKSEQTAATAQPATASARNAIQAAMRFVDERTNLTHVVRERDRLRARRSMMHSAPHDLPVPTSIWTSGALENQIDWWSVQPTSPSTVVAILGSALGDESDVAMVTSALLSALSVARKGIGPNLDSERMHLVLHTTLVDLFGKESIVPAIAWRADLENHKLDVASAGHRTLWHIRDGTFRTLRVRPGTPLGASQPKRSQSITVDIRSGDHIIALSNGVFEVESPTGDVLRESRLRTALLKALERSPHTQPTEIVQRQIEHHAGAKYWGPQASVIAMRIP